MSNLKIEPKFSNHLLNELLLKKPNTELSFDIVLNHDIIGQTKLVFLDKLDDISLEINFYYPENININNLGYGTKASKLTMDYAFSIGIEKLIAFVHKENVHYQAAIHILRKLGFTIPYESLLDEGGTISFFEIANPYQNVNNFSNKGLCSAK